MNRKTETDNLRRCPQRLFPVFSSTRISRRLHSQLRSRLCDVLLKHLRSQELRSSPGSSLGSAQASPLNLFNLFTFRQ